MNKSKVNKVVMFFAVLLVMISLFSMPVFAESASNNTYTHYCFTVPDDDLGGYHFFWGDCHTQVHEIYSRLTTQIYATYHNVLGYVENWEGDNYDYSASCIAPTHMDYYNGSTSIGSQSLSFNGDFWKDGSWACWDNMESTASRTFSYTSVTAKGTCGFFCDDSITTHTQTTSVTMN